MQDNSRRQTKIILRTAEETRLQHVGLHETANSVNQPIVDPSPQSGGKRSIGLGKAGRAVVYVRNPE